MPCRRVDGRDAPPEDEGHDVRPHIREWFRDAGLDEIAFDSEPVGYGVGVNRRPSTTPGDEPIPERLFSFVR